MRPLFKIPLLQNQEMLFLFGTCLIGIPTDKIICCLSICRNSFLGRFSHAPLPFTCGVSSFDDIPIWMPPSPPNSEADATSMPSFDIYSPIDGALFYQPGLMTENELPPLPPLLPSLDAFSRGVSRSPRKTAESPLRAVMPMKQRRGRKRSTSATKIGLTMVEERQQQQMPKDVGIVGIQSEIAAGIRSEEAIGERRRFADATAFERPPSPPESAPNTPIGMTPMNVVPNMPPMPQLLPVPGHIFVVASSPTTLPPKLEQIGVTDRCASIAPGPSSIVPAHAVEASISTLDEAIESTLRKSRKHVQSPSTFVPVVPRYLIRNFGPLPQQPLERVGPDSSRHIFRLVCPEWRANFNALPMPGPIGTELADFEGVPWNAAEDQRLLKAISERHCLMNASDQLLTRPGVQFNWELVSQYVNIRSNQFRSPRQCALRYQNFILRCDEAFEENSYGRRGQNSASPLPRRPRNSFATSPTNSVIFDANLASQEASGAARRRATQLANCALLRRRMAPPTAERTKAESQNQLFCLTGRMPPQQEAQLNELGTRYTNVARATDIIDVRRQMLERRAQHRRVTPAGTAVPTTTTQ